MNLADLIHSTEKYSSNSRGLKHPLLPLGIILRDQNVTDIYAGKAKIQLKANGNIGFIGNLGLFNFTRIYFNINDSSSISFGGKKFSKQLFKYMPSFLTVKKPTNSLYLVTDKTYGEIIPNTGKVILQNLETFSSYFDEIKVLEKEEATQSFTRELEGYQDRLLEM